MVISISSRVLESLAAWETRTVRVSAFVALGQWRKNGEDARFCEKWAI